LADDHVDRYLEDTGNYCIGLAKVPGEAMVLGPLVSWRRHVESKLNVRDKSIDLWRMSENAAAQFHTLQMLHFQESKSYGLGVLSQKMIGVWLGDSSKASDDADSRSDASESSDDDGIADKQRVSSKKKLRMSKGS
jgi:hypothetical protein